MGKFLYSHFKHTEEDNKIGRVFFWVANIAVIIAMVLFYNFLTFSNKDKIVDNYLKALRNKDETSLVNLVAKEYDPTDTVKKDIQEFGGFLIAFHTNYHQDESSGIRYNTSIYGIKGFKFFKKKLTIEGIEDAWYVIDGKKIEINNQKE